MKKLYSILALSAMLVLWGQSLFSQCTNAPSGLNSTAVSETSASISWTTGNSGTSTWKVEYGPYGFTQGTGTILTVSSTSTTVTNLYTDVVYDFYVRDQCGTSTFSAWSSVGEMTGVKVNCYDNFDGYPLGYIAPLSTLFNGWAGNGGDGAVSNTYSNSGSKSLKIFTSGSNGFSDIVAELGTYTSGIHSLKFDFFIPTTYGGYYNILHNYTGSSNVWAIEVYFDNSGVATVQGGTNSTATLGTYDFNMNAWNTVEHIIDLDNDTAFIKINGEYSEVGWQFSLGSSNYGDRFNAVNFYSAANSGQTPLTYFDNFCVSDAPVNDAGLVQFVQDNPNCGDTNYGVKTVVQNFAENNISGFDIVLDVTGSTNNTFTYTYNGILRPGRKDTIAIGIGNNLSGGTYAYHAYTDLTLDSVYSNDTIDDSQIVVVQGINLNLGQDTFYCSNTSLNITLDGSNTGNSYTWSTGSTSQTIQVDTAGTYWVEVGNSLGCVKSDTLHIDYFIASLVNLGSDISFCSSNGIDAFLNAGNFGSTFIWSSGETTQTKNVTEAGSYSVAVTNAAGCVDRDTVEVVSLPSPDIQMADQEVCDNQFATLDAGAGSTYEWSNGSDAQTVQVNIQGLYSVTVTGSNGCIDTGSVYITVKQAPVVELGADIKLIPGHSVTLDAGNPGATFIWSTGATKQKITVSSNGTYKVTVTNDLDCEATDDVKVKINLGLNEIALDAVKFYPNPVSNSKANLEFNALGGGKLNIQIYSVSGQLVYKNNMSVNGGTQKVELDLGELNIAVYTMRLTLDGQPLSSMQITVL
jgi:hypothetical protein